jgi:hypothetical protein
MKRTSKNVITQDKLELVLLSLRQLADDPGFAEWVVPIIERCSAISLRTLEYFVITYCKKYRVSYRVSPQHIVFYYPDYKAYLTSFPKKLFDPFRRTDDADKIHFAYGTKGQSVQTTVGQLNFFKWALQYKVIEYVHMHLAEIQHDMKRRPAASASASSASSASASASSISSTSPVSPPRRQKRMQAQHEWPIHGIDSPSLETGSWSMSV